MMFTFIVAFCHSTYRFSSLYTLYIWTCFSLYPYRFQFILCLEKDFFFKKKKDEKKNRFELKPRLLANINVQHWMFGIYCVAFLSFSSFSIPSLHSRCLCIDLVALNFVVVVFVCFDVNYSQKLTIFGIFHDGMLHISFSLQFSFFSSFEQFEINNNNLNYYLSKRRVNH